MMHNPAVPRGRVGRGPNLNRLAIYPHLNPPPEYQGRRIDPGIPV
jgi:hypothetical protein